MLEVDMSLPAPGFVSKVRSAAATLALLALLPCATARLGAQDVSPQVQQLYTEAQQAQQSQNVAVAEQRYKRILQLAPNLGPAYNNLGRIYFNQGQYRQAIDTLTRGLAVAPDMAPAQVMLGASLLQIGNAHDAVPHLEAAVAALPDDRFARVTLVRSLIAVRCSMFVISSL